MKNILILCTILVLFLGCTNAAGPSSELVEKVHKYQIKIDEFGEKTIDQPVATCKLSVLKRQKKFFSITAESEACDPLSPALRIEVIRRMKALVQYDRDDSTSITISIYLLHHPSILKKWAKSLKKSPEWNNRPKPKSPWDTSEYPLIVKLMNKYDIFRDYKPLFDSLGYQYKTIRIQKVAYQKAEGFSFFKTELEKYGYSPEERIPVPLMSSMEAVKITGAD